MRRHTELWVLTFNIDLMFVEEKYSNKLLLYKKSNIYLRIYSILLNLISMQ